MKKQNRILADGRWTGNNGIGRFSREILSRLHYTDILNAKVNPLSLKNLFWQKKILKKHQHDYQVYFSPGFNPIIHSPIPFVATLCDLIHLKAPGHFSLAKKCFYEFLIKPTLKKAAKVITISDYSKKTIIEWAGISPDKIINVSCGYSDIFTPVGIEHHPGYPYFLYVGNSKYHKNLPRLLQGFYHATQQEKQYKLILTALPTSALHNLIKELQLQDRVVFSGPLEESLLAEYYRGATALILPSLYEGFGLPALEAMACATPVIASHTTSIPEVTQDAAILINPYEVDSISDGISQIIKRPELRDLLIKKGLKRVKLFSWEKTARKVQRALEEASLTY